MSKETLVYICKNCQENEALYLCFHCGDVLCDRCKDIIQEYLVENKKHNFQNLKDVERVYPNFIPYEQLNDIEDIYERSNTSEIYSGIFKNQKVALKKMNEIEFKKEVEVFMYFIAFNS